MDLNMAWSLTELYPDFTGKEFTGDLELLDEKIDNLLHWSSENFKDHDDAAGKIKEYIRLRIDYSQLNSRLSGFASLSYSADAKNSLAKKYLGILEKKNTALTGVSVGFSNWLCGVKDIEEIIDSDAILKEHRYYLNEIIRKNRYVLSEREETIISKMRLTGSSAWANYKNLVASNHKVEIELDGKEETVGINKVKNMYFSKNRNVRKTAFYAELKSNDRIAEAVLSALNSIKGEVITLCELKGYESPLQKTLSDSRMDAQTLDTMLSVMKKNLPDFQPYFKKKAAGFGCEKLAYYDIPAPLGEGEREFDYEEARDFIVKNFNTFTPVLGALAERAFNNRWIDAEARDGKRGGAFCHNLHSMKQSRILSTFEGSLKNVISLSHELGHAYHGMILDEVSPLNTHYPMPLAETASIFAENIVRNAALREADKEEAKAILGAELANCASVIVDIYARFIFEKHFFDKRKAGELSLEETKALMVEAEKEAYGEAVDESTLDPYAWIHKPHYYYAERNFYNFPYAFGLLFAKGLYSRYLKEGPAFVEKYNAILRLTGQADVYDVAKFAGIDLHNEAFWQSSMDLIKSDINKYAELA